MKKRKHNEKRKEGGEKDMEIQKEKMNVENK
jgi:hypothetical protein